MIVEIKCNQTTFCMGNLYQKGETYFIDSETAKALGPSVELTGNHKEVEQNKEIEAPIKNKMIGKAPKKK